MTIETAILDGTDIEVSRICIGCWQAAGWSTSDDERFVRTVRHALDSGLNFLDTAVGYGGGHSEELVGRAIEGRREDVVVASKLRPGTDAPEDLREELEGSLQRLGTDYIDLYQQHWPSGDVPLADTVGELVRLKAEGKIRAVGVSNYMEPEWEELDDPGVIDCLQPNYSLLWRSIEPNVLPLCRRHDIGVITYSTLCQGILAGKFESLDEVPDDPRGSNQRLTEDQFPQVLEVLDVLKEVAENHGRTMAQTAIRWVLEQDGITAAIVGASRPEQVDDNLGALGWELDEAACERLSEVSWPLSADLEPHDTLWNWHPREN